MNEYNFLAKRCKQEIKYGEISKDVGRRKMMIYKFLSSCSKDNLSLSENGFDGLLILDAYITAYITSCLENDSLDAADRRTVIFEHGGFEKIFHVTQILPYQLEEAIRPLMNKYVTISYGNSVVSAPIFESVMVDQEATGLWKVKLTCSSALERVFLFDEGGELPPEIE